LRKAEFNPNKNFYPFLASFTSKLALLLWQHELHAAARLHQFY